MKGIFYSFIIGAILGGGGIYYLLNISSPVRATIQITSSDPNAKISQQNITVKSKRKVVEAQASFQTDRAGIYTNTITLNRRDLQYPNMIQGQFGYFMNSQLMFLDLGYSYKHLLLSAKIGYSFRLQTIDYGLAIGGKYSF